MSAVAADILQRIRWAAAQESWDNRSEPEPEDDEIAGRRYAVECAQAALSRALRHLDAGSVILADNAIADAMGELG